MAEAGDESSTTYVPPGYRRLTDVVAADGLTTVRDRLASGEPTFGLSLHTGKMIAIPIETWRTHAALEVLETGFWYRRNHSGGPYSYKLGPAVEDFVILVADKPAVGAMLGGDAPEPEAAPSVKQRDFLSGPQASRALPVLKKLYPPDGDAPDEVTTEDLCGQVNTELAPDNKNRGLGDISPDTIARVRKYIRERIRK